MEPVEIVQINQKTFHCDGGNKVLGHPRVFLNIGRENKVDCPYCGRRYILNVEKRSSI
ncbi:MAG: zinc-finger domain-containing protein [Alphaproteobacteria bacterium]|nr:zinc-finger domain-containing protein [Alphaproteobacteria bacterium]